MKSPKAKDNKAKDIETKMLPKPIRRQPDNRAALQFIDGCVATAPLSRVQHIQAQQAMQQLSGAVAELEKLKK